MANAIRRVNRARRWAWLIALLPALAQAHPEWSPIRVNRYTKLALADSGQVRIVYTLLYGDGPAWVARKDVDLDANGRIDEREKTALGARALAQVRSGLQATLDGRAIGLHPRSIDVGLAGDVVAAQPFSIDLVFLLEVPVGPHTIALDDRVEVPSEGDTEVSIDAPGTTCLIAAYQGRAPGAQQVTRLFAFRGPRFSVLEDRGVTIQFERVPTRRLVSTAWRASSAAAALAVALIAWRRRRRT